MNTTQLIKKIEEGALSGLTHLYRDTEYQKERIIRAIREFEGRFGKDREVMLLSVPGRSELLGNHTDHNGGKVMAGAIDRDVIAVASKNGTGMINIVSEGYPEDNVELSLSTDPNAFADYSSAALIAGVANGLSKEGYTVSGFDAYTTSDVLKGSGISSSAAYEVMIGNIINHLFCDGEVSAVELAKIAQYAENVYFGKPSGLMDQMACAVGGFVYIDFADSKKPVVEPISFSISDYGYELCIVNTGGNHADLNDDYASVPREMRAVASIFGKEVLRGLTEEDIIKNAGKIRTAVGDRALMRALHFLRENDRVAEGKRALCEGDINSFFDIVNASGSSSFKYLQNLYTNKNVSEQGLSLALAITEGFAKEQVGAMRVHGGGFAGTVQAYVKRESADAYSRLMESVFGEGAVMRLVIRPVGATRIL